MFSFLLLIITFTTIPSLSDDTNIIVDEWGVVIYSANGLYLTGAPDEFGFTTTGRDQLEFDMEVDAPIIWIHGATFDRATFTVKANSGELTTIFPPSTSTEENQVASWEIYATSQDDLAENAELTIPTEIPFAWAMNYWQKVPSLELYSTENNQYLANFLYYETSIRNWTPPYSVYESKMLAGLYATEGLLITTGSTPIVERIQLIPTPNASEFSQETHEQLSRNQISDVFDGWAAGRLSPQEIETIWQTWTPFFTINIIDELINETDKKSDNEQWILFPLPLDVVEEMSTINLEVHDSTDYNIIYNRLFLGLVRIN